MGVFRAACRVAFLVANPVWARISNRRGNRLVILIAMIFGVLMPITALTAKPLMTLAGVPSAQWAYVYVSVFALWGLYESGAGIGGVNLLLDIAPPSDRAIYIGFTNSVLGVVLLSTSLGGVLADLVGLPGVFIVALLSCLGGLVAIGKMREPR